MSNVVYLSLSHFPQADTPVHPGGLWNGRSYRDYDPLHSAAMNIDAIPNKVTALAYGRHLRLL